MALFSHWLFWLENWRFATNSCQSFFISLLRLFDEARRSKWTSWIIFQVLYRFWVFLYVFMYWRLISAFLTVSPMYDSWQEDTWWMVITIFQFKQLFNFVSDLFNVNIVFIISQTFWWNVFRTLHLTESMVYSLIQSCFEHRRNQDGGWEDCDTVVSFLWFFLKVINDTIDKSVWIVSIKKLLFNFWYLICWKAGYAWCSVKITNYRIPFVHFWNLWWLVDW